MDYIVTKSPAYFTKIGDFNFCSLEQMKTKLPNVIACDGETTHLKAVLGDIFCIQFGTGKDNFIVHMYDDNYHPEDVKDTLLTRELILQNGLFDLHFFAKYGIYPPKVRDTFLASKILYNGIKSYRHGFADIFKREMGIIYDTIGEKKKEAAAMSDDDMLSFSFSDLEDEMSHEDDIDKKTQQKLIAVNKLSNKKAIKYCFQDVDRLIELHDVMLKKIDEGGFRGTYDLHCRYIRALAYMEHCGLPINVEKWKAKISEDVSELEKHTLCVTEYLFDNLPQFRLAQIDMFDTIKRLNVKLTSPLQMLKVFKAFGINTKNAEGKDSISEDVLNLSDHEFIPIWLNFKEALHTVTTFGNNILDKVINGRIYTSFNPILDTARISTSKGDVNVLNMPQAKRTRECIECIPGHSFIVADYDSQEVRVSADLTQDSALISSILNGDCLHCAFARVLYPEIAHLSDKEIKQDHGDKRGSSKAPRFCFQYGGTAYTLTQNTGRPLSETEPIESAFKELHADMYVWGEKELEKASKTGYIEYADGFKLQLPYYPEYKKAHDRISKMLKSDWKLYKEGKKEFKAKEAADLLNEPYTIINQVGYRFYKDNKGYVSKYFKLKSQYMRLCLNASSQGTASHQTKLAACLLFEDIEARGLIDKVLLVNIIHDEFNLETIYPLDHPITLEYTEKIGKFMVEAGNQYLTSDVIQMSAEGKAAQNWYDAK